MRRHWDDHELMWFEDSPTWEPDENGWYWVHNEDGLASGPFDTDEDAYAWVSKFR